MIDEDTLMARTIPAFAEIYVNGNTTSASVPTGTNFTKVILPNTVKLAEKNCAVDLTSGTITANKKGHYSIGCTFSSKLGTTDVMWDTAVFVNDVEIPNLHMRRKFSTLGYTFNVAIYSGSAPLNAGDVLDIRVKHNNASSVAITTEYANISLHRIGI